ncbi:hypothetical protein ACWOMK_28125 [Bacillus thuringiensis]
MTIYNFYFDESSHDRAITYKDTGLNIYKGAQNDLFLGVFWGFKQEKEQAYQEQYLYIENQFKQIYELKKDQEFKGTTISKKNFKFGFRSFNPNTLKVYTKLFEFIDDKEITLHIHMYSKTEYLILQYFQEVYLPPFVNRESFIYSIIKFLFNYRSEELMKALFANRKTSPKEFLDNLKLMLKKVISKTKNVERKIHETSTLQDILYILDNIYIKSQPREKYEWDYKYLFIGLHELLEELSISPNDVHLTIDPEGNRKIYNTAKGQGFHYVYDDEESSENALIRVADILSNMLHRLTLALYESLKEAPFVNADTHDYATRHILNEEWFDIKNEEVYQLYVSLNRILKITNKNYWTIFSGIYYDYALIMVSLIEYIGEVYESFNHFNTVAAKEHTEKFNNHVTSRLAATFY